MRASANALHDRHVRSNQRNHRVNSTKLSKVRTNVAVRISLATRINAQALKDNERAIIYGQAIVQCPI
jgi:hypothetical protein